MQYRKLERDHLRRGDTGTGVDPTTMKPNMKEKEIIDKIVNATNPRLLDLKPEEEVLVYRFRYSLTDNKKALTKYLMYVDWSSETEVNELPTLLSLWKSKAPIDISDALKLLGRYVSRREEDHAQRDASCVSIGRRSTRAMWCANTLWKYCGRRRRRS